MSKRQRSDEGLTLIELLIVLVILPIIIGAAAEAFIVTIRTDASTSGRIADSSNAQLAAAYFARDVQGALEVTTNAALAPGINAVTGKPAPFGSTSPQVCGPQSVLSASAVPVNETLIAAFYRPAQAPATATDIGYWWEGSGSKTSLTRYSCSLSPTFTATSPSPGLLVDNPFNPNAPGSAISSVGVSFSTSILPLSLGTEAAAAWTFAAPVTVAQSSPTLGSTPFSLTVAPVKGFTTGYLTVLTTNGLQTIFCPTLTGTTYSGCTGRAGTVLPSSTVTQSSIKSVQATVTSPTSSYRYVLLGTPQGASPNSQTSAGAPALLILGTGDISLNGTGSFTCPVTGKANRVCVQGNVVLDGGLAQCTGNAGIGAQSIGSANSSNPGNTCDPGQINPSPVVGDYIGPTLPASCFTTAFASADNTGGANFDPIHPNTQTSGVLTPGIYANPISNAILEPGVYVLEGGISNGGGISMATPLATDGWFQNPPNSKPANYDPYAGVLLYIPGTTTATANSIADPPGCLSVSTAPQVSLKNPPSSAIAISPLDQNQSQYWFGGNPNVADLWMWQDATNGQQMNLQGGVSVMTTSASPSVTTNPSCTVTGVGSNIAGVMYIPGATLFAGNGGFSLTTGRLIAGGVSLGGTPDIMLTGC